MVGRNGPAEQPPPLPQPTYDPFTDLDSPTDRARSPFGDEPPRDPFMSGYDGPPPLPDPDKPASTWSSTNTDPLAPYRRSNTPFFDRSRYTQNRPSLRERLRTHKRAIKGTGLAVLTAAGLSLGATQVFGGEGEEVSTDKTSQEGEAPSVNNNEITITTDEPESTSTTTSTPESTTTTTEVPKSFVPITVNLDVALPADQAASEPTAEFFPQMNESPGRVNIADHFVGNTYVQEHYDATYQAFIAGNETGGRTCVGADIMIPSNISEEAVELSARYSPVLSTEQVQEVHDQLEATDNVEEMKQIFRDTFMFFGVESVEFSDEHSGEHSLGEVVSDGAAHLNSPEAARAYLIEQIRGLQYFPAEALNELKQLEVSGAEMLVSGDLLGAGTYASSSEKITLYGVSERTVVVHEVAHHIHNLACQRGGLNSDEYLKAAYDKAIELVATLRSSSDIVNPFPSNYSQENYKELFAELTTALALNGLRTEEDLASMDPATRDMFLELQELTIERTQAALPNTDVIAWFQLTRLYAEQEANHIEYEEGVSVYDFGSDENMQFQAATALLPGRSSLIDIEEIQSADIEPAVIINRPNGAVETIEARTLANGQKLIIMDGNAPDEVTEAAHEFLRGSQASAFTQGLTFDVIDAPRDANYSRYGSFGGPFRDTDDNYTRVTFLLSEPDNMLAVAD